MKPTRNQLRAQILFERRQAALEKKWSRIIRSFFVKSFNNIAKTYEKGGVWQSEIGGKTIERIYGRLYTEVTLEEARREWQDTVEPHLTNKKDFIDDLIQGVVRLSDSNVFLVWREILGRFIALRTTGRITRISDTTQRMITEIIEKGIKNGDGAEVIGRAIRKAGVGEFNRNRSVMIARTEVITSLNQGKFMAAESSPFVMEKKWMPVFQPGRTRESHILFFNSDFIDLKEHFTVGIFDGMVKIGDEIAMYPGDLSLSARNVINCRCSLITRSKRDSNNRLIRKI